MWKILVFFLIFMFVWGIVGEYKKEILGSQIHEDAHLQAGKWEGVSGKQVAPDRVRMKRLSYNILRAGYEQEFNIYLALFLALSILFKPASSIVFRQQYYFCAIPLALMHVIAINAMSSTDFAEIARTFDSGIYNSWVQYTTLSLIGVWAIALVKLALIGYIENRK